jgi:hypothetical protein
MTLVVMSGMLVEGNVGSATGVPDELQLESLSLPSHTAKCRGHGNLRDRDRACQET